MHRKIPAFVSRHNSNGHTIQVFLNFLYKIILTYLTWQHCWRLIHVGWISSPAPCISGILVSKIQICLISRQKQISDSLYFIGTANTFRFHLVINDTASAAENSIYIVLPNLRNYLGRNPIYSGNCILQWWIIEIRVRLEEYTNCQNDKCLAEDNHLSARKKHCNQQRQCNRNSPQPQRCIYIYIFSQRMPYKQSWDIGIIGKQQAN